jgi:hypothetical protein
MPLMHMGNLPSVKVLKRISSLRWTQVGVATGYV